MKSYTHLTSTERQIIANGLNNRQSFNEIGRQISKNSTTISREVRKHITLSHYCRPGVSGNDCKNRYGCKKTQVCSQCTSARHYKVCKRCPNCNSHCPDFVPDSCKRLEKAPYVCNGCTQFLQCSLKRRFYKPAIAQEQYENTLSESRSGISFTANELSRIDNLVSPLIKQGQSPHHICMTQKDSLMVSERTIYNLIDSNVISVRNLDLHRKVRFKPRKKKRNFKVDKACRINRNFECFKKFMAEFPDTAIVELDSVEGVRGGKVLLTVHFVKCEMMLAFLRERNDSQSVIDIFNELFNCLDPEYFRKVFFLLLADNGSEFSNPQALEFDENVERRTRVFYCDPNAPYQKGSAERNHEFIRYFIPKGADIGQYSQQDITLMMNHINSYSRESLGGKCPFEVFRYLYGNDLLDLLGCTTIPANEVTLNKSIFRKEKEVSL